MIYLPDTNAWIAYVNPGASAVKARFRAHPPTDILFCSVVKAELFTAVPKFTASGQSALARRLVPTVRKPAV